MWYILFIFFTVRQPEYDRYLAVFKGQTERYRHVRLVFTGRDGAGKTTVCRRLQNKTVHLESRQPTVGAVVHPDWVPIDWESKRWRHHEHRSPSEIINTRIAAVMINTDVPVREPDVLTGSQESTVGSSETSSQHRAAHNERVIDEIKEVRIAKRGLQSNDAFLSLWDMGGHTSFQASHNVFISSHGVYLLVFRLTDFLKDQLETARLRKWLRLIGTFSAVAQYKPHAPPLIFVGTFLDELRKTITDYEIQVGAIRLSIAKFPELSSHKFIKFCTLDNSLGRDDKELDILRDTITESAEHQDQWDRKLPTTWLKLEMDVLKKKEEGTRILALTEVVEMNKASIAPLADVEEIKLALEYLHSTRSVIYFREFDYIIIDPQWLADFFCILITDDQFLPKEDLLMTLDLELYMTKGELTHELIHGLLSLEKNKAFLDYKPVLLALMEKFGLIVRLLLSPQNTENAQFSETYTIPSKLRELQVQNIHDITDAVGYLQQNNLAVTNTLCFVFNVNVPDELFHRLFAQILRTYRAASPATQSFMEAAEMGQTTISNTTCLYRGFGCFEVDDLCRMILSMHAERSTIALTLISPTESQLPADSGQRIRLSIEQILRDTLQMSNQQHFQYTHQLHCNFHLSPHDTPVRLRGVLHAERGVPCKGGDCQGQHRLSTTDTTFWNITEDSAGVQGGENVPGEKMYILNVPAGLVKENTTESDTDISNRRPTPREIGRLSRLVDGSRLELLFLELGLSYPEIKITIRESSGLAGITQITKLFVKWTNTYPNQTFQHIEMAMAEVGMATDRIPEVVETDIDSLEPDMVPNEVLSRSPTDAEIKKVVDNTGNTFYNLCLELGLSPPIIEQHEMGHPVTFQARMCALLRCWIDRFQRKATIGRLLTAMKVCQMDWHTTAKIWSGR